VRVRELEGHVAVEVAALARSDESGLRPALDGVVADVRQIAPPISGEDSDVGVGEANDDK
jgi:hypothetical protein